MNNWSTTWGTPPVHPEKKSEESFSVVRIPSWDSLSEDALLMEHKKLQDDLASLKAKELELRKYIGSRAFPAKTEGTNTKELGNGYELKAVVKYNYKLADNEIVQKVLDEIAACGNEGPFIADRLVSWTPNFLKTEYIKLQEDAGKGNETAKKILRLTEVMLTITEAAPTLTIKEPKK